MYKRLWLIYVKDYEYSEKLSDYINLNEDNDIKMMVFKSANTLSEFLENNKVEVLILEDVSDITDNELERKSNLGDYAYKKKSGIEPRYEAFSNIEDFDELISFSVKKVVYLTDNKKNMSENLVYRYQRCDELISEINRLGKGDSFFRERDIYSFKKTRFVGVYSPIGGSGKTTFAITYGRIAASENKVLYINFDEFSGLSYFFNRDNSVKEEDTRSKELDFSDLLYHVKVKSDKASEVFESVICKYKEIEYIVPSRLSINIKEYRKKDWENLFEFISADGRYEEVILDFSNIVGDIYEVLLMCDQVFMPIINDCIFTSKIIEFEEALKAEGLIELSKRIYKLSLPFINKPASRSDFMNYILYSEMGDYIRNLRYGRA